MSGAMNQSLLFAAYSGNVNRVRSLLQQKADVNAKNKVSLVRACVRNNN